MAVFDVLFAGLFFAGFLGGELWRFIPSLPFSPLDLAAGYFVFRSVAAGRYPGRKFFEIWAILGLSWVLGLRMFSPVQSVPGFLYLARTMVYSYLLIRPPEILKRSSWLAEWAFFSVLLLGLLQYAVLPDTRFLLRFGWDEHYFRLIGTVLDPNYFGVMAGVMGLYAINKEEGRGKKEEGEKIWKRKHLWLASLAFLALVLTFSRASWIAFGLGMGWWAVAEIKKNWPQQYARHSRGLRPRVVVSRLRGSGVPADPPGGGSGFDRRSLGGLKILGILGILGAGVWWAAPKPGGEGVNLWRTASIEQRAASLKQGLSVWARHPWLGVGFNNYAAAREKFFASPARTFVLSNGRQHTINSPSSSWMLLLSDAGIIGVAWGILWMRGIGKIGRFWSAILLMIGVHAIFNNSLFYPPILAELILVRVSRARRR